MSAPRHIDESMQQNELSSAIDNPFIDFDRVCQKVRATFEQFQVHAISLHDERGDLLWLTENAMTQDEHDAVRSAFETFSSPKGRAILAYDLGDSRSVVLFRAVNAERAVVGAISVITETRAVQEDGRSLLKVMSPQLQRALSDFAAMRRPGGGDAPKQGAVPEISPEVDRLHAALRRSPIALHVQRLVPLAMDGPANRYEVLLRSTSDVAPNAAPQAMLRAAVEHGLGSMIDRRVLSQLIAWLVQHPEARRDPTAMFSVNLTKTALHDEHFIKFVDLCLAKSLLPKSMIAFEIDVLTAVKLGDEIARVADALHQLGCPLVLDDFAMRTECFDLLRLPAVRYIKMSSDITARMRSDRLSQAAITAVVQMARVLAMHTVAKRTETAAEREWLTALGVDFIQSNAMSAPISIDSLLGQPAQEPLE